MDSTPPDQTEAAAQQTPHALKVRGLMLAALIALGMSALKDLFLPAFFHFDSGGAAAAGPYIIFGLGVAIALAFLVGYPLWTFADNNGLSTPIHAAILGAALGALIGLAHAAFFRDALTTEARTFTIFSVLWTILAGAICGFAARTVARTPKQKARE
ncbi:MAG TPA: hypothetical protein VGO52_16525 [Hyphomonadaceae bacterium]|jgi:hypothetical protein|nr:hypothetical protein [Hyphomonadaceae bacterium]